MDIVVELYLSAGLATAIHIDVKSIYYDIVEYLPVKIIEGTSLSTNLNNIPHILGKPSLPINNCIVFTELGTKRFVWFYNGYITHIFIAYTYGYIHWVRYYGNYVMISGCYNADDYQISIFDKSNKLQSVNHYKSEAYIETLYGDFIYNNKLRESDVVGCKLTYQEIEIPANTYYNRQGEPLPAGLYKGLVNEYDIPLGYFYSPVEITPELITNTEGPYNYYEIIEKELPKITLNIPIITSQADLVNSDFHNIVNCNEIRNLQV